jgi:IclR family transcriptional regulator, mhp operon transcriptional activator
LVLDGVYRTKANGVPEFVEIPAPSDEDVRDVLKKIIKRVMKQLVRRGILVEDQGETYLADDGDDSEESRTLRPLHRGSCLYRIAFGPRAGQKVLTLQGALPRERCGKQKLCANLQGFSLPAGVQCGACQRKALERLCRCVTRPALANDRVQINDEAQLVEAASPVLERLCKKVDWPSVLAVPRMDYMEVIETNSPKSYFSHIPLGPIGFKINMLRSATGRCYLGFCGEPERHAILQRLRASSEPGDFLAKRPAMVTRLLNETKRMGYGERYQDFGGNFNLSRREWNDGRDSIAVPIVVDFDVVAVINLTWFHKVKTVEQIVAAHLGTLKEAAAEISRRLIAS